MARVHSSIVAFAPWTNTTRSVFDSSARSSSVGPGSIPALPPSLTISIGPSVVVRHASRVMRHAPLSLVGEGRGEGDASRMTYDASPLLHQMQRVAEPGAPLLPGPEPGDRRQRPHVVGTLVMRIGEALAHREDATGLQRGVQVPQHR